MGCGGKIGRLTSACLMAAGLAGCVTQTLPPPTAKPVARPVKPAPPAVPSAASRAMERHFARVQADLLTRGLLRTDGGGPDTPFNSRQLAEDFIQVALYDEYTVSGGMLMARRTESALRRWDVPIRFGVSFGATIPKGQRATDRATIANYAARLQRVSGHPVSVTAPEAANYHILFVNEDERRAIGPKLRRIVPDVHDQIVSAIENMSRATFCVVLSPLDPATGTYSKAVAIIRSEQPDLLRKACIHEELAQGMGLANDSPAARPSIFNDDDEFAYLTTHDELLLKILYDRRLSPGLTPDEARPIVTQIAEELVGGSS